VYIADMNRYILFSKKAILWSCCIKYIKRQGHN